MNTEFFKKEAKNCLYKAVEMENCVTSSLLKNGINISNSLLSESLVMISSRLGEFKKIL